MNIIDRIKNILINPKTEWLSIDQENDTPQSLLTKYVIPLALIPAVCSLIGYGFIGVSILGIKIVGLNTGLAMAFNSFAGALISYYVCTYIIDALAPNFLSEKNINKSAQLVAYSFTASWVAGIFYILPSLSALAILGLYSIYIFYVGLPTMKRTPQDKVITYMIVSALVIIVINAIIGFVLQRISYGALGVKSLSL